MISLSNNHPTIPFNTIYNVKSRSLAYDIAFGRDRELEDNRPLIKPRRRTGSEPGQKGKELSNLKPDASERESKGRKKELRELRLENWVYRAALLASITGNFILGDKAFNKQPIGVDSNRPVAGQTQNSAGVCHLPPVTKVPRSVQDILGATVRVFCDKESGSGFIFKGKYNNKYHNYILTCAHLNNPANLDKDIYTIGFYDKENNLVSSFQTKLFAVDPKLDLAILVVPDNAFIPTNELAVFRDTFQPLEYAEPVFTVGAPMGLTNSISRGCISNPSRGQNYVAANGREYPTGGKLIQTDAAINPGNSGGPLVDSDGKVVGINVMYSAGMQGVGYAVGVDTIKEYLRYLGIEPTDN